MPSLLQSPFLEIVSNLPVEYHSELLMAAGPKNNWRNKFQSIGLGRLWADIFGGKDSIRIERGRLLNYEYPTPEQKCAEVLLWGYPGDMRGIVSRLLPHLSRIADLSGRATDWQTYYSNFNVLDGIDISTITKLAYFHKKTFNNEDALILDSRLIKTMFRWNEVTIPGISYGNAPRKYLSYLSLMHAAASQISDSISRPCTGDQLELFLFCLGEKF